MRYTDALGNTFKQIPKEELRIVSLVPSQTELLIDLGLENQLVGITKFCVHPVDLRKKKEVVGGTKQLHAEKVAALKPNIILCNKEENTKEIVESLQEIAPVWVTDMFTLEDSLQTILDLGQFLDVSEKAFQLVEEIHKEADEFAKFMKDKPERKVLYFIWKGPYMAAGKNTFVNDLLQRNKMQNVLSENSRYPEVSPEKTTKPDIILLSSEPFPFAEKHRQEVEDDWGVPTMLVDGEYFSWYGSRLRDAFAYFKSLHKGY